ncbi:ABC transporter permease [Leuconostoc gasicomitatum]|uniref:ABC transporter permease n=1 Tax=Leuconostoc gasicomitatum TaxID=115778 RepID=UPI000BD20416|nr:ABC transporter permease [Leuconostoc gasicomitatum]SOC02752.1 ABC transporter permease EcsB [Leuconostoc gasicomitatum]
MMKINDLFVQRFVRAQNINIKYLKLLFNDHFVVFLLIAFGASVLGYRQLILSPQLTLIWQSAWWQLFDVLWLIIGLQMGTLVTYFKPADRLYLLSNDYFIAKSYMKRSIEVSTVFASVWQVIFVILLVPVFWQTHVFSFWRVGTLLLFTLSYKLLLLLLLRDSLFLKPRVNLLKYHSRIKYVLFNVIVPGTIMTLILQLPSESIWIFACSWLIVASVCGYFFYIDDKKAGQLALDWTKIVSQAIEHEQRVLHFYATFAEVPNQSRTIKRRKYLDFMIRKLTKQHQVMYRLYLIRLIRVTEVLPLLVRLELVGAVVMYALLRAPIWLIATIAAMTMYLIIFQMIPIYSNTKQKLWTQLLPIDEKAKQKSFQQLAKQVMFMTTILLAMVSLSHGWLTAIVVIIVMYAIGIFLNKLYIPKKIK